MARRPHEENIAALSPEQFPTRGKIHHPNGTQGGTIRLFGPNWAIGVARTETDALQLGRQAIKIDHIRCKNEYVFEQHPDNTYKDDQPGVMLRNQTILSVNNELSGFAKKSRRRIPPQTGRWHVNFTNEGRTDYYKYFPVKNGTKIGEGSSGEVLVDVFKTYSGDPHNRGLAQLVNGTICIDPFKDAGAQAKPAQVRTYFNKIREALGLNLFRDLDPADDADKKLLRIYLHPHGFSVYGALALPWREDRLEGWFTVSNRDRAVSSTPASEAGEEHPGLFLYTDHPDKNWLNEWEEALAPLRTIASLDMKDGPEWLDFAAGSPVQLAALFWPATRGDSVQDYTRPYVSRDSDARAFESESGFLNPRLKPSREKSVATSALEFGHTRQRIDRDEGQICIASVTDRPEADNVSLRYAWPYRPANTPDKHGTAEIIAFANGEGELIEEDLHEGSTFGHEMKLAVPMIETAARLRRESGLPDRGSAFHEYEIDDIGAVRDPVGPLWVHAPIENGLLHFPIPDATQEGFESILAGTKQDQDPETLPPPLVGALRIANGFDATGDATPGSDATHRPWELSVTSVRHGSFACWWELGNDEYPAWKLAEARLDAESCQYELNGAFPVLPFAQTSTALIPSAEVANLRQTSLRGVSVESLRGLEARMERRMRDADATPKTGASTYLSIGGMRLVRPPRLLENDEADAVVEGENGEEDKQDPAILEGRVNLECTIATLAKDDKTVRLVDQPPVENPALRPWVWTRFDGLPAVQIMPLANTGDAARKPSSQRELMPLQRTHPSNRLTYVLENGLDMAIQSPRLVVASKSARYAHPLHDEAYVSRIGHALMTLPSASVFAGAQKDRVEGTRGPAEYSEKDPENGEVQWQPWRWHIGTGLPLAGPGSRTSVPLSMELRHDLALRDEHHALAAAQSDRKGAERPGNAERPQEAGAAGGFTPLPNNAPMALDGNGQQVTPWRRVWSEHERALALAASDKREMVKWSTNQEDDYCTLDNFIAGEPLTGFERVELNVPGADTGAVLGAVTFHTKSGTPLEPFAGLTGLTAGLPDNAESLQDQLSADADGEKETKDLFVNHIPDLQGYSDGKKFAHGTLIASHPEGSVADEEEEEPLHGLEDQWGHTSNKREKHAPTGLIKQMSGGVALYSTSTPIVAEADWGETINLWFSDLSPFADGARSYPDDSAINGNETHLHAFRWGLTATDEDWIKLRQSFCFRPLRISKFHIEGDGPATLTIQGEIGRCETVTGADAKCTKVRFVPQLGSSLATLTISEPDENGKYSASLTKQKGIIIPLNSGLDGVEAALELPKKAIGAKQDEEATQDDEATEGWLLHLDVFRQSVSLPLTGTASGSGLAYNQNPAGPEKARAAGSWLKIAEADLSLADGKLRLKWEMRAQSGEITVAAAFEHPEQGTSQEIAVDLHITGPKLSLNRQTNRQVHMGPRSFALDWDFSFDAGERPDFRSLFEIEKSSGALMGVFKKLDTLGQTEFADTHVSLECALAVRSNNKPAGIEAQNLAIAHDSSLNAKQDGLTLAGQLTLSESYIKDHTATVRFENVEMFDGIKEGKAFAAVAAHVSHKFASDAGFTCAQYVWLKDASVQFYAMVHIADDEQGMLAIYPAETGVGGDHQPTLALVAPLEERVRSVAMLKLAEARDGRDGVAGWPQRLLEDLASPAKQDQNKDAAKLLQPAIETEDFPLLQGLLSNGARVHGLTLSPSTLPKGDYETLLAELAERMGRFFIADPGALPEVEASSGNAEADKKPESTHPMRVLVPSPDHTKVIETLRQVSRDNAAVLGAAARQSTDGLAKQQDRLRQQRRLLANLAPWAEHGLMLKGAERVVLDIGGKRHPPIKAESSPFRRLERPRRDPRYLFFKGQEEATDPVPAYLPQGSTAQHLRVGVTSEAEVGDPDALLAVQALLREWSSPSEAKDGHRALTTTYSDNAQLVIEDNNTIAFTPAQIGAEPSLEDGKPIKRFLRCYGQEGTDPFGVTASAFAPRGVDHAGEPVSSSGNEAGAKDPVLSQWFAPHTLGVASVALRSGVMDTAQFRISSHATGNGKAAGTAAFSSAPPLHLRSPRPPLIGRNDRTRASEFGGPPMVISEAPQFHVFGPRRASPIGEAIHPALSREPLARSAWTGTVTRPNRGVIAADWGHDIAFELKPLAGAPPEELDLRWKVHAVTAQIGERVFFWIADKNDPNNKPELAPIALNEDGGFRIDASRLVERDAKGSVFADAAEAEIGETSAEITVELRASDKNGEVLVRHPRFPLLLAGRRARPMIEPIFLTFEDPQYNETLRVQALQAGEDEEASRLIADRSNVRPDDVLTIYAPGMMAKVKLALEVQRPVLIGKGKTETIKLEPIERGRTAAIDLRHLKQAPDENNHEKRPVFGQLKPGDILKINITGAKGVALYLPVTLTPLAPGNPASFGLLQRTAEHGPVNSPLYVLSPTSDNFELVDGADLEDGIARFRASHIWPHFPPQKAQIALQKCAGSGAMFVSSWFVAQPPVQSNEQEATAPLPDDD